MKRTRILFLFLLIVTVSVLSVTALENMILKEHSVGYIFLSFDDAVLIDDDTAIPILQEYGWKGVAFFAMKWQFPEGFKPYRDAGWEIGCHTYSHCDLNNCSAEKLQREIVQAKFEIEQSLGVKVVSFAFPSGLGRTNETVLSYVRPNYKYIRSVTEETFTVDSESVAVQNAEAGVKYVKDTGLNAWFMFHAISDCPTVYITLSTATFRKVLDIIQNSGVKVVVPSQLENH